MQFRNLVIGAIRFSYPALSGFERTPADVPGIEEFLYDPDRLDRRFHLFETLCLPSLLGQSDPDFIMIFLTGENMPARYLERLADLIAPMKSALIVQSPPMDNYGAIKAAINRIDRDGFTHRTTFRFDDDDGLTVNYIANLKARARQLHQPDKPWASYAIASNRGFYLELSKDGNRVFDVTERLPLGLGLSLTTAIDRPGNVYLHNHRKIGQYRDTFGDMMTPAFIRSVHRDNDAGLNVNGLREQMTQEEIARALKKHFSFSLDDLLAI